MNRNYIENFRKLMINALEKKLNKYENLSSLNYNYYELSIQELELLLLEYAALMDKEECDKIKNIIRYRIIHKKIL